ncbi:hypothetical protein [Arthrobacter sp. AZCC_0090]|uniref:hypothetical protein n=1 Tax=Arthrobacter sp. AZCC_0090 TaxID=2735881 RepID=UPI0017CC6458|nr:hypothetical protein [Arthrobacter sp. AZCC_0090]MBB6406883.1 hypothetical protein [Arthrobacter sp. AZCC_0090]
MVVTLASSEGGSALWLDEGKASADEAFATPAPAAITAATTAPTIPDLVQIDIFFIKIRLPKYSFPQEARLEVLPHYDFGAIRIDAGPGMSLGARKCH